MYVCMHACMHVCGCRYVRVCVCARVYVRACVRASVRACVRAYDVTNLYKAKFENRDRYGLTFFLMGCNKQGVVQWQTKLGLRMGKALICNSFLHYLLCNICILGNI